MKATQFVPVVLTIAFVNTCLIHCYDSCRNVYDDSGNIEAYREINPRKSFSICWEFSVEEGESVTLNIKEFYVRTKSIYPTTVNYWWTTNRYDPWQRTTTFEEGDPDTFVKIVPRDSKRADERIIRPFSLAQIVMRENFNISLEVSNDYQYYSKKIVYLYIQYVKSSDLKTIEGIDEVRNKVATWLKNELQLPMMKWKTDIHRSVIALQLSHAVNFSKVNFLEELLIKQLDLKTSVSLLRNSSDPVSLNNLGIMINALLTSCHDPRKFFGYNLVELLKGEVEQSLPNSPAAFLALCNANESLSQSVIDKLENILSSSSEYLFLQDLQAFSVMALSCIRRQNKLTANVTNDIYGNATELLLKEQLKDGSFGNIYSTAVITQALLSNENMNRTDKRIRSAVEYLVHQLNSSSNVDFLSAYYSLPLFNEKTLLDIAYIDCSKYPKRDRGGVSDIENKLGKKIMVQYSLFVGEKKDVIHNIALRVAEDTTAFEIMQLAAEVDPKYTFEWKMKSKKMYIYRIAGITNDPEEAHFWLMYYKEKNNSELQHIVKSPDQVRLRDDSELILWYKTVQL